jgi:hypothetical protein
LQIALLFTYTTMTLAVSNFRYATLFHWIIVVVLLLGVQTVQAQDWSEDPLKKPQVWKKLIEKPTDAALWEQYCGKPMNKLSIKQLEEVNMWKQELMLRQLADQEAIVGLSLPKGDKDFFLDENAFTEIMGQIEAAKNNKDKSKLVKGADGKPKKVTHTELAGMEAIILQEQSELAELKTNVHANFAMIEEYYKEVFEEFGLKYVYYAELHPDKKYSEMRWVEEKEKELKAKKMQQIQELRKRYVVASGAGN